MNQETKNKLIAWIVTSEWFEDIENDLYSIILEKWKHKEETKDLWRQIEREIEEK